MAFAVSLLLVFHFPLPTNGATKLVEGVCKEAVDYATKGTLSYGSCLEALESDSRTRSASDLKDLAKIALQLALANATASKAYIDDLLKKNHTAAIEKCFSLYKFVVGSFWSALQELDEDVMTANYDVKIAGDDASACENELLSGGVKVPEISRRNNDVQLYSSIGFVITNKL